jgi:Ca2+-binding RTX toxin-like protein
MSTPWILPAIPSVELPGEGTDRVNASIDYTLGPDLENLTLTGTLGLNGTGNELNNVLVGNTGANTLSGLAGDDSLDGGTGINILIGGPGDDTYTVDGATDTVVEAAGEGIDLVRASGSYTLPALEVEHLTLIGTAAIDGTGNDLANVLLGNAAANVLTGGLGDDSLNGAAGADTLVGGPGNDATPSTIRPTSSSKVFDDGIDTVSTTASYVLSPHVETLTLAGTTAINGTGSDDANTLQGNSAANVLDGAGGNDLLIGAAGADTLLGGDGDDIFRVTGTELAGDTVDGGPGLDTLLFAGNVTLAAANVSFSSLELLDTAGFTRSHCRAPPSTTSRHSPRWG